MEQVAVWANASELYLGGIRLESLTGHPCAFWPARGFYSGGWKIGVLGFDFRRRLKFFSSPPRPERLWGPHSLLSNGY